MCQTELHDFVAALPKVEQHLHIEGTLEPEMLFALAAKNGVALPSTPDYASPQALRARYARFASLDDFLGFYYRGMSALVEAADFEALAWAYLERAASAGNRVRHAEIFFDPQAHTARGVAYDTVVAGLSAAKRRAEAELGLSVEYVVCILRHLPVAESHALVDVLLDRGHLADGTLAGFGMVSSERDFPPSLFTDVFARVAAAAPRAGLTSHAGEEAPAHYIADAIRCLGVTRIDHGLAAAQDPALLASLAANKTLLTFCPWSNVALRNLARLDDAPVRTFLDARVRFSINSDDPAYFGAYIQDVYCRVHETFDLSVADWEWIVRGSIEGSWCSPERKATLVAELETVLASFSS
jgi:adenosine deaminase